MDRKKRRAQILEQLNSQAGVAAGDLARQLGVSRMTIHRDLVALADSGELRRIHGGAVALRSAKITAKEYCKVCERALLPHQSCLVKRPDGTRDICCCAACGLRRHLAHPQGELLVRDQINGRQLPATEAHFLVNSLARPCCQPSVISFADAEEAALFQEGFGGTPARFSEILEFLRIAVGLGKPD